MSEQDLILIEQYYRNELSEAQRLAFEQRMAEDTGFREEAILHRRAMNAIHLFAEEELKKKLRERPVVVPDQSPQVWRWVGAAIFLLAIFLLGYWWTQGRRQTPAPQPLPLPSTDTTKHIKPPVQQPDTTNPVPPSINRQNSKQTPDAKKLFAEAYQPYRDGTTGTTIRSGDQNQHPSKKTDLNQLKQLSLDRKYAECLKAFDSLPQALQQKEIALFFKANSLLALGRMDEAAVLFEGIASITESSYASHAQWYAALCALKKGDLTKSQKWLQVLASSTNASPAQREEAKKLLKKLQ